MGGHRAPVCTTRCSPIGLCRWRFLLGCRRIFDLHLHSLLQGDEKLVLGPRFGAPAQVMGLQFLDDMTRPLDLRVLDDQHLLGRFGITGKLGAERGQNADAIVFIHGLRGFLARRNRRLGPLSFMHPAPVRTSNKACNCAAVSRSRMAMAAMGSPKTESTLRWPGLRSRAWRRAHGGG